MMKFSLDLTNKQELNLLSDLIADVQAKVPRTDILLVGAMARDLLLFYAHGIKAARGTEDVDLLHRQLNVLETPQITYELRSSIAF
jgi:predicted nucleotidyltransferase